MKQITEIIRDRALFVAGKDAWFRKRHDAVVERSLANAEVFLAKVVGAMGTPEVTGGTTVDPNNVITLYWLATGADKIAGVFVRFNADGSCDVSWDVPPIFSERVEHMSIAELLEFNVPAKLKQLRRTGGGDVKLSLFDP